MINQKKKSKNNKKILLYIVIFSIILIGCILGMRSYAKYITSLKGNSQADIAKWSFEVNGNTNERFIINLGNTRTGTQEAEVQSGYIGPGTSGQFIIEVDATGTEVSLDYNINMEVDYTDNHEFPQNLIFYSDSKMKNAIYHTDNGIILNGYIAQNNENKKIPHTIYWKWDYETGQTQTDKDKNDEADSFWIGKNISIAITVVGEQVNQNSITNQYAVTYDANGGIIEGYGNSGKMTKTTTFGELYGELPNVSNDGYDFIGWTTNNLLDYNNLMAGATYRDIYVDENGNIIDSTPEEDGRPWKYELSNWYTVVGQGSYVITLDFSKFSTNQYSQIAVFGIDGSLILSSRDITNVNKKSFAFEVQETMQIGILAKGFDGIYKIKLEKGNTATEWVPYKNITSESEIGETNGNMVVAQWKRADYDSRNILNYNNLLSGAVDRDIAVDEDGYISDATPNEDGRSWDEEYANWKMGLEPGFYTLTLEFSKLSTHGSSQIQVFESDNKIIDSFIFNASKRIYTFQIKEQCELWILCKSFDGVYRIKLEKGLNSTDWKPYY